MHKIDNYAQPAALNILVSRLLVYSSSEGLHPSIDNCHSGLGGGK